MAERVKHCGKQVTLDGAHLADAVSPEAAEVIAICLNYGTLAPIADANPLKARKVTEFFA